MSYDLEISQGGTFILPLIWQDSSRTPIDITGRSARMHIRPIISSPIVLIELTSENGRIAVGGAAGNITLTLTAEETSLIDWTFAVYDLEIYYDDSGTEVVNKIINGNITVVQEVTRVQDTAELTAITFITANTNMEVFG